MYTHGLKTHFVHQSENHRMRVKKAFGLFWTVLLTCFQEMALDKREGVIVKGTTVAPGFKRIATERMQKEDFITYNNLTNCSPQYK